MRPAARVPTALVRPPVTVKIEMLGQWFKPHVLAINTLAKQTMLLIGQALGPLAHLLEKVTLAHLCSLRTCARHASSASV